MQKTTQLNFRLSHSVKRKLLRLAHDLGKNQSAVLRALVLSASAEQFPRMWGAGAITKSERDLLREIER